MLLQTYTYYLINRSPGLIMQLTLARRSLSFSCLHNRYFISLKLKKKYDDSKRSTTCCLMSNIFVNKLVQLTSNKNYWAKFDEVFTESKWLLFHLKLKNSKSVHSVQRYEVAKVKVNNLHMIIAYLKTIFIISMDIYRQVKVSDRHCYIRFRVQKIISRLLIFMNQVIELRQHHLDMLLFKIL